MNKFLILEDKRYSEKSRQTTLFRITFLIQYLGCVFVCGVNTAWCGLNYSWLNIFQTNFILNVFFLIKNLLQFMIISTQFNIKL